MPSFNALRRFFAAVLAVGACISFATVSYAQENGKGTAKNVILFIGDGDGFNSELLGTYYHTGKEWGEVYQSFPVFIGSATFCVHKHSNGSVEWDPVADPDKNFGYSPAEFWKGPDGAQWRVTNTETTDSAASSTALNSGHKTVGGYVGKDMNGNDVENFAEKNIKAGRSAGMVSTNQISHATPAGGSSHNINRNNYAEIGKEQIEKSQLTVLIGSGHPEYNNGVKIEKSADELNYNFVGGRETWENVKKNDGFKGWSFIDARSDFAALAAATPDSGKELPNRLLGIVRTTGDVMPIDGDVDDPDAMIKRFSKTTVEETPSLSEMTLAALNVLSQNKNGFYVLVEGGSIDHANHGNNADQSCLEHTGFAKAIEAAVEWVEKYSSWDETLIIVTSDHETGQIWGDGTYVDEDNNGRFSSKKDTFEGFEKIEKSKKGKVPAVQYLSTGHTNSLVPFWAKGAGADCYKDFVRGKDKKAAKFWKFDGDFIFNSDVYNIMSAASGIE